MTDSDTLARVTAAAEARQLPALIEEWSQKSDPRRWLALALRIDLAVLVVRPELVVPCVYRRLAWFGREGDFYEERLAAPRDSVVLREVVENWRWRMKTRWLRSLRPPEIPLDGGVIEEYRCGPTGTGELRFAANDQHLGIAGGAAWDRKSGHRVSDLAAPSQSPAVPRWTLGSATLAGQMVLESEAKRWTIAHNDLDTAWGIHELSPPPSCGTNDDELVMVSCSGDDPYGVGDDEPAYYLVNVTTGKIVWRALGNCSKPVLVRQSGQSDQLFVRTYAGIVIHALATGERVAEWTLPGDQLAVTSDGSGVFATQSRGGVIRVWDPARIPETQTKRVATAASSGFVEFSPDGERLATGHLICDARDGSVIAKLDLHGVGSWLEGGPPADCRRLCNGVFIEQTPFGLYAWDTSTRSTSTSTALLVVEDHERSAEVGDAVCFDPAGLYHAQWHGRSHQPSELRPLRLFALRDGQLLFEHEVELARVPEAFMRYRLGFSSSGGDLWWETADGKRFAMTLATGETCELAMTSSTSSSPSPSIEEEPAMKEATVVDGLLIAGDLAVPIDSIHAIASPDGRAFASSNAHYVIEESG